MSDTATNKQLERIEVLLSKSLLGEQFVNTQFHVFSARSASGRVVKPRVLSVNNTLLANGSKYFADLLSSERRLLDPSLVDILEGDAVPSEISAVDYGYESDSDLDDDDPPVPLTSSVEADTSKVEDHSVSSVTAIRSPSIIATAGSTDDEEVIEDDGSDAIASDIFLLDQGMSEYTEAIGSNANQESQARTQETKNSTQVSHSTGELVVTRTLSPEARHILVKDGAFRTWYALLHYLYTGIITFLPLKSAEASPARHTSELSCSAKSMYRFANKMGLDDLRTKALDCIRRDVSERNILMELSSSLLSSHPQLLEAELNALNRYMSWPSVVKDFPLFARRIANKEIPHGSEIIVFIASKLSEARHCAAQRPSMKRASSQPAQPINAAEVVQRITEKLAIIFSQPATAKK